MAKASLLLAALLSLAMLEAGAEPTRPRGAWLPSDIIVSSASGKFRGLELKGNDEERKSHLFFKMTNERVNCRQNIVGFFGKCFSTWKILFMFVCYKSN